MPGYEDLALPVEMADGVRTERLNLFGFFRSGLNIEENFNARPLGLEISIFIATKRSKNTHKYSGMAYIPFGARDPQNEKREQIFRDDIP
jgi:hypothetical protein